MYVSERPVCANSRFLSVAGHTKVLSERGPEKLPLLLSQTSEAGNRTEWGRRSRTSTPVICRGRSNRDIVLAAMTHFPQTNSSRRSPRVQLNGSVAAAIRAEGGQKARAKLQSISITGGLLQLPVELSSGDFVEIAFHTRSGAIHGMAEMLQPVRKFQSACLQPFRFVALGDEDHRKLRMALDTALDRSFLDPVSDQLKTPPGL